MKHKTTSTTERQLRSWLVCGSAILWLTCCLTTTALASAAAANEPQDLQALYLKAESLRNSGDLEEAKYLYKDIARQDAHQAQPRFWLATIHRWQGDQPAAVDHYSRALQRDPNHTDALKGRARSLMALGHPLRARTDLERSLRIAPQDVEAVTLLAQLLAEQNDFGAVRHRLSSRFQGGEYHQRLGDVYAASDKPKHALREYAKAERIGEDDVTLYFRIGDVTRQQGRHAEALRAFNQALEVDPNHIGSLYWKGVLSSWVGKPKEALQAYDAMLSLEPDNIAALIGKGRILAQDGNHRQAATLIGRALDQNPENGEALIVRGQLSAQAGDTRAARRDYQQVLSSNPDYGDARIAYDRLTERYSWSLEGITDRSQVVEGLEDEGLSINGVLIRPVSLEYITEGIGTRYRSQVSRGLDVEVSAETRREAVLHVNSGTPLYDLDISEATVGLHHRLSPRWNLQWNLGGVHYQPQTQGSIEEATETQGNVVVEHRGGGRHFQFALGRSPFIHRGFAQQTQFSLFQRDYASVEWSQRLSGGLQVEASAQTADFGQAERQTSAAAGARWQRNGRSLSLFYRQEPFPERFLTADGELDFVDFDGFFFTGAMPLAGGLRLKGEGIFGRFGATPRQVQQDGALVSGPAERNNRAFVRGELLWSPPRTGPLSLGVEGLSDNYSFDAAAYNTNDTQAWGYFVDLSGEPGARVRYAIRAGQRLVDDDRDDDYTVDLLNLRLEFRLGGSFASGAGAVRLGVEGSFTESTLEGIADTFVEEAPRLRLFLITPLG